MASIPSFLAPPAWANQDVILYHGTLDIYAKAVVSGINPALGNPLTDFGLGFYTTTVRRQAKAWAWQLSVDYNARVPSPIVPARPVVIRFDVPRDDLAGLDWLVFVRGDAGHDDYWSLVHHCRSGRVGHARWVPPNPGAWYDVVAGPVAAFWRTRLAIANSDQFSFHTPKAAGVLDRSPKRAIRVRVR